MGWLSESLNSSIGKKIIMAVTGTFLIVFLTVHLLGNLTLFANDGGTAFNNYAHLLRSMKFTIIMEIGLGLIFFFHIFNGIRLWIENKKARPINYAVNGIRKNTNIFSRTMAITGSVVFIFLVIHLKAFFVDHTLLGKGENLFVMVKDAFNNPIISWFYVIAVAILSFHLNHGFQSAFQTFGWNHKKYTPFINALGIIYSTIIGIGFAAMPIYFLFFYGGK
ncbi:MAG TPA: succinate dehydrogenase cytochrome b subunit [Melioribacteraceae bacterium]|nr:succinate dehydrogenase cytochrome b subunit [Melioribacteraceae bacterium]